MFQLLFIGFRFVEAKIKLMGINFDIAYGIDNSKLMQTHTQSHFLSGTYTQSINIFVSCSIISFFIVSDMIDINDSGQMPTGVSNINNNKVLGPELTAKASLFDCMFHIAIENVREENYFTEKLIDALGTINSLSLSHTHTFIHSSALLSSPLYGTTVLLKQLH
jgi:hypothetical protein